MAAEGAVAESSTRDGRLKFIYGAEIPATSKDGGSAEVDMESSPPMHNGMTILGKSDHVF